MIGMLGVRIWMENRVDFANPVNLMTAAVALIVGIADYTWTIGDVAFAGIALGTFAAVVVFHLMRAGARVSGALADPLAPLPHEGASVAGASADADADARADGRR